MNIYKAKLFAGSLIIALCVGFFAFATPAAAEKYEYTLPGQGSNALRKMAYDGTYLWIAGGASHKIYKMDANLGTVVQTFTFAADINPYDIIVVGSDIWATDSNPTAAPGDGFNVSTPFLRIANGTTQQQYRAGTDYVVVPGFFHLASDGVKLFVIARQEVVAGYDFLMSFTIADLIGGDTSRDWECRLSVNGCGGFAYETYADGIVYDSNTFGTPVVWLAEYTKVGYYGAWARMRAYNITNGQIVAGDTCYGPSISCPGHYMIDNGLDTQRGCGLEQDGQYLYACSGRVWLHKIEKTTGALLQKPYVGSFPLNRNGYLFGNDSGVPVKLKANAMTGGPTYDLFVDSARSAGVTDFELTQIGGELWMWTSYSDGKVVAYLPEVNILGNPAVTIGTTSAIVSWTTDLGASRNKVYYRVAGTSTLHLETTPNGIAGETAHTAAVTGLTPGTNYEFFAYSEEPAFTIHDQSAVVLAATTTLPDIIISRLRTSYIGEFEAQVDWDTNVDIALNTICYKAQSEFTFDCSTGPTTGDMNNPATQNHSFALVSLTAGTTYQYYVGAEGAGYSPAQSSVQTFTTLFTEVSIEVTGKIYIDNDPFANITGVDAMISWHTRQSGNHEVYYGTPVPAAAGSAITNTNLNDITCVNNGQRCWAVGNNGVIFRRDWWLWQGLTSGVSVTLHAVTAVGTDFVWAVGDNGTMLFSMNGGDTWTRQASPFGAGQHIYGIAALSNTRLYAVTHIGNVIKTQNAGNSWTTDTQLQTQALNDITFRKTPAGGYVGCIAGYNGGLWRFSLGTWVKITLQPPTTSNLSSCDVAIGGFGESMGGYWAVGPSGGVFIVNGFLAGTKAFKLSSPSFLATDTYYNVQAYPGGRAWFVGTNGKAFYTDDSGSNWNMMNFNTGGRALRAVSMEEPTSVQILGDGGANFTYAGQYPSFEANIAAAPDAGHIVGLTLPAPLTTYHYKVVSRVPSDTAYVGSWDHTFTTGSDDTTPPDWTTPNLQKADSCNADKIMTTLTWTPATDTGSGIDHYEVWRKVNSAAYTKSCLPGESAPCPSSTIPAAGPYTYTDGPLATSTTYRYKVRAYNVAGLSTESPEITFTTGTQTFNLAWGVPVPPDKTVSKGTDAVYGITVTRDWCFNGAITWQYVSSSKPTPTSADLTASMFAWTAGETLGTKMVTVHTNDLSYGKYSNILIRGVFGSTTRSLSPYATLTIEDPSAPTTPPTITNATVTCGTAGSRSAKLDWSAAVDAESLIASYEIHRSLTSGFTPGPSTLIATVAGNILTYNNTGLQADKTYYYIIVGISGAGARVNSAEYTVSTFAADCDVDTTPPSTPPTLSNSLTCGTDSIQDVVLNWTQATDAESGIDRYEVYRGATKIFTEDVNPPPDTATHTYTDSTVGVGNYTYRIDAWNNGTPAAKVSSNTINVTVSGSTFTLDVQTPTTASVTVASGTPALYTLKVTKVGCFNEDVALTWLNYTAGPANIDASKVTFAPAMVNPSTGPGTSTMTINTTGLPPGTYRPLRINGGSTSVPTVNIDQTPQVTLIIDSSTCIDAAHTPNLTCKATISGNPSDLPLYCNTATSPDLVDKCSICGCPDWTGVIATDKPYCNTSSEACELKCSDGTSHRTCSSSTSGSYCDLTVSFNPIEDCTKCTSPTDGYCDAADEVCNPTTKKCEKDTTPPAFTCPITCTAGVDYFTVDWCTDELSTSGVKYGTTPGILPGWISDMTFVNNHSVTVGVPPSAPLAANTTYLYRAVSDDKFGNRLESGELTCSTTNIVDVDPPSCTRPANGITAPANGAIVSGNSVPFTANVTDNIGVDQVQFRAGGILIGTDTGAPYGVNLDTTRFPDGTLQLTITGRDAAGNTCGDEIFVSVVNDTAGPTLDGDITVEPFNGGRYVRVRWKTNEASQGWVAYGIAGEANPPSYTNWDRVPYTSALSHEVELGPLQVGNQYGAVIRACDVGGNCNFLNF